MNPVIRVDEVADRGWVTGARSANATDTRFGTNATDLGISWDAGDGSTLIAFGDSYGPDWGGDGAGPPQAQWRFNLIARSFTAVPEHTVVIDDMVCDTRSVAQEVLHTDPHVDETTVIPTAGIHAAGIQVVHYMSVRYWGGQHGWRTNYAALAHSLDGVRWINDRNVRWDNDAAGDHPFQLAAFAKDGDGHILMYGTRNGRRGPAFLARVDEHDVLDRRAYRYWNGTRWSSDEFAAAPVIDEPVGELSVQFDAVLGCWLASHLSQRRREIVLRSAPSPTGPFSSGAKVIDDQEYPGMYGGFLWPGPGHRAEMLISQWGPYNVRQLGLELSLVR